MKLIRFFLYLKLLLLQSTYLLLIFTESTQAIGWLSLLRSSSIASINTIEHCDSLKGLNKKQKHICKKNVEVMDSVRFGADKALRECQHQFMERRWNCSTIQNKKVFGNFINDGTREAAFVHAMSSAGVAHAVTQFCSTGQVLKCGCDRTIHNPQQGFQWSGCSDNIAFGVAFAKSFVDAKDLKVARSSKMSVNSSRALMNLHNNEAGRKVIMNNMKIECKCHGVSGSCELKTCWRSMLPFREIGNILKEKFDSATEVQFRSSNLKTAATKPVKESKLEAASMIYSPYTSKSFLNDRQPHLIPLKPYFKHHTDTDLIYLHSSPDFCERDDKIGSLGTHGRICKRTSKAIDGCELLCCGRGYKTRIERMIERCNCKFHWCCYVECDDCWKEIEINTCL